MRLITSKLSRQNNGSNNKRNNKTTTLYFFGFLMDKLFIRGAGLLAGEIRISGSNNAALPLFAATILADSQVSLHNVPHLNDITTVIALLRTLGLTIERKDNHW